MKKIRTISWLLIPWVATNFTHDPEATKTKPVVIAYVAGFRGLINTDSIDAQKVTHINYAFINIKDYKASLHYEATDTINFRRLNALKRKNPDLKILISIGGWTWSENFSDAVLTEERRQLFAQTSADIVYKYNLDGVDIDWEYPGLPGEDNVHRPEDKQNYTRMFKTFRVELDRLQTKTGKRYLLTTAVGGFSSFIEHTEMNQAHAYLDYVNIMTYDFHTGADSIAGHHTNLYPSSSYAEELSGHRAVNEFKAAGVPAGKLVIGIAFYGRAWQLQTGITNGFAQPVVKAVSGKGYTVIKDSLTATEGYVRYWDTKAKAPYLFQPRTNVFVSYDDEESVREKCGYVKENKLAGVMFWEYFNDPKNYLLNTIHQEFH